MEWLFKGIFIAIPLKFMNLDKKINEFLKQEYHSFLVALKIDRESGQNYCWQRHFEEMKKNLKNIVKNK